MSADIGVINMVVAGIAIPLALLGIERMFSYFKKRHDTLLKNSYNVETLFTNVNNLKESVDDTNKKQEETTNMTKEMVGKLDILVEDTKETRKTQQKLINVIYKHDDQIRLLGERNNINIDAVARRHNLFDEQG